MGAVRIVAVGLAIGLPVAVTAFEVIGGPAAVTGSSMQVSTVVKIHEEGCTLILFWSSPPSIRQGAEHVM